MKSVDASSGAPLPESRAREALDKIVASNPPEPIRGETKWPGWARMTLLLGGSALLWAAILAILARTLLHG